MLRRLLLALALAAVATAAVAQPSEEYLVFSNQAQCQARAQQQCQALHCDGVFTVFWWNCTGPMSGGQVGVTIITAGSYALQIDAAGPFGVTTSTTIVTSQTGLSALEQAALLTQAQLSTLLPVTGAADSQQKVVLASADEASP